MKTKYLDAEIERLNLLERNDELTDWGKEMLIELKEIKQSLLIQRVSSRREQLIAFFDKASDDDVQECINGFAGRVYDRLQCN